MRLTTTLMLSALAAITSAAEVSSNSTKRGLIYIPQNMADHPEDEALFLQPDTSMTWYYNYQSSPSPQVAAAKHLQFVPMMWGNPETGNDFSFSDTVLDLKRRGLNITHVMGFNEPDGDYASGGSEISPLGAAASWIRVLEPLREKHGIKLVGPATTGGPKGFVWLAEFFQECAGRCHVDVLPVHWYGDFGGLASHIGEKISSFEKFMVKEQIPVLTSNSTANSTDEGEVETREGKMKIWVTEYAYPHGNLQQSQQFFNESAEYFDRLEEVERYSYFGAFRSDRSNVGPYAAFLTQDGNLTDIGSLYLGGGLTGNVPDGTTTLDDDSGAWSLMPSGTTVAVVFVGAITLLCL